VEHGRSLSTVARAVAAACFAVACILVVRPVLSRVVELRRSNRFRLVRVTACFALGGALSPNPPVRLQHPTSRTPSCTAEFCSASMSANGSMAEAARPRPLGNQALKGESTLNALDSLGPPHGSEANPADGWGPRRLCRRGGKGACPSRYQTALPVT
jgi:hypothetical protein